MGAHTGRLGMPSDLINRHLIKRDFNHRVLIVDDDTFFLNEFEDLLKEHGFMVTQAVDGEACLDVIERKTPDLILLDIAMPRMDGFQVIRKLRAQAHMKYIPIIVISGKTTPDQMPRDCRCLASAIFAKPFDFKELLDCVAKLLHLP
ncbi:MAG: two-component system response regulator [Candidatus Omnitrophica bacterium CG11_big_fil_rev_8_21_14_0_20_45_26]|uniref:Two-component system response regulator n=1 Tax=Candidatus Abzuiibacterium crystallinum TaxID=1974748 RepID=A0A2H0LQE6_9BACT|nr:MAG: two-component system response regulator [Candidatus Omnitrophica bacterium CG11_big_fil_rev_8_21_14_0_20_45_26]PIW63996.1 MAG: two-component system response regulator [Candidatus Omnitrophica bacterium CG12_big_fil_rev_8_21_14_0_65_45_16]